MVHGYQYFIDQTNAAGAPDDQGDDHDHPQTAEDAAWWERRLAFCREWEQGRGRVEAREDREKVAA